MKKPHGPVPVYPATRCPIRQRSLDFTATAQQVCCGLRIVQRVPRAGRQEQKALDLLARAHGRVCKEEFSVLLPR